MVAVGRVTETATVAGPRLPGIYIGGESQTVLFAPGAGGITSPDQVDLILLTTTVKRVPASIELRVVGATPGADLTFTLHGTSDDWVIWTDVADTNGNLGDVTISLPADLPADTYNLELTTDDNGSDSATLTVLFDPLPLPPDSTDDTPPIVVGDSANRWVFQDELLGSWVMPVNPTTMSNPHFKRTLTTRPTVSAPGGQYVTSEGVFTGQDWRLSGYCPDQAFYDQLKAYAEARRRIWVIDHRGRAWKCGIRSLSVEPRKRQSDDVDQDNDWAGNWTMDLVIYDQTPSEPQEPLPGTPTYFTSAAATMGVLTTGTEYLNTSDPRTGTDYSREFAAWRFTAGETKTYEIAVQSGGLEDYYMLVYTGPFDDADVEANLIEEDDDSSPYGTGFPMATIALTVGQQITIVVATFNPAEAFSGPVTGFANGLGTFVPGTVI